MEPTLLDSIAAPPATDIELTTVVAFAAGVLLWVRGAKLTESATLILGLAGGGLVGARLASVGGLEGVGTLICCILAAGVGVLLARAGVKAIVAVGTGVVMAALLATGASEGLFDQFANAADEAMAPAREVAREASEQAENLGAFTTADDELDFNLNPNWWEEIPRERRSITVMAGVGGFFIGLALGGLLTRKMQALFSAAIGAALWLEAGHTMLEIWLPTAADRVGAMEGWAAPAWAVMALLGAIIQWSPDRRKSKPEVDEKDAD